MRLPMVALILLAACSHSTQLTSGAAYVAASSAGIDADLARAAAVEPDLRFPARIGVAKVMNGALVAPGAEEAALLAEAAARHPELGTFVPVSPIVLELATGRAPLARYEARSGAAVYDIRLAAARQHLDHVLIYAIGTRAREGDTPFAIADVTLIGGALLPTRAIRVAGVGQAMLVDVRNGYPYGTAQATEDLSGLARSFGTDRRSAALQERVSLQVARKLIPEIEAMLADLASQARH